MASVKTQKSQSGPESSRRSSSALSRHQVHQLSDIAELSGSSNTSHCKELAELMDGSKEDTCTPIRASCNDAKSETTTDEYATPVETRKNRNSQVRGLGSRATSALSLPVREVPKRQSSASIFAQSLAGSRQTSTNDLAPWKLPPIIADSQTIPSRPRLDSPVRQSVHRATQSSDALRASPSRTFVRTSPPLDILDHGCLRHSRVELGIRLPSPLYIGGGTVEGQITMEIDGGIAPKSKLKPIYISTLSVDVIGVEEVYDNRRWIFLSLASELIDKTHPPPPSLVVSQIPTQSTDLCWEMKHTSVVIPFCINLPLNLGPPPYLSKQARIRYMLCPSAMIKIGEKRSIIRQTWYIQMLPVHDPRKALASLANPLLATDTLLLSHPPDVQSLKLTAGLHRQTWVNGSLLFVDMHITNNTAKIVKKIECQLIKTTLWYSHSAAGTVEKSASHLRLPKRSETEVARSTTVKKSKEWKGIKPQSSEVRTCELDIPRGHVTISTGRYFEIRYFINVIVNLSIFKSVAVQLPVTIIHINSLDILPNSLAQVSASIEAKRAKTVPLTEDSILPRPFYQGQVFDAPRRQSLDRARNNTSAMSCHEIDLLSQALRDSPRRFGVRQQQGEDLRSSQMIMDKENFISRKCHTSLSQHNSDNPHLICCHCHLLQPDSESIPPTTGPKLPRLQVSTSGLGFSESEFEVPADSPPRKVMLSEQERKMINQQRELKLARQWSKKQKGQSKELGIDDQNHQASGWHNVALTGLDNDRPIRNSSEPANTGKQFDRKLERITNSRKNTRVRSGTNPDNLINLPSTNNHRKALRSVDLSNRPLFSIDGSAVNYGKSRYSKDRNTRRSIDRIL